MTSDVDQQIETIELTMEAAKAQVSLRDALLKLTNDRGFTEVILKGYFENEASRLVLMKATPGMQEAAMQESIMKQIDAIGVLREHFRIVIQLGNNSERALVADQATHAELLAEGTH